MRKMLLAIPLLLAWAATALAVELGDDGLHKTPWMRDTFKDLREDLAEANAEGKRLAVIIEQRGCIYCTRMHEEVFPVPEIDALLNEKFFFVQINMFGDIEVTDFDGESLPEREITRKWGALFTPTLMFFPESVVDGVTAQQASVATMPGAFGKGTTYNLLNWVLEHGYEGEESFQKYHARKLADSPVGE
ncbi:thioredoxin fold domain-containing protein [Halovulum dunhuangense]|uniref:Thioredoxin fold domain-containing protein n=1 Tax=Halovulum dunhuangense TaxID=1505036 RepID=A0A849KV56_9RHOB|nr:thioredoxin family protein [Halovulum dunhuangense]NNU79248.1 thioredoxin fold domain-containing protein [Halovulum dunhuangense]